MVIMEEELIINIIFNLTKGGEILVVEVLVKTRVVTKFKFLQLYNYDLEFDTPNSGHAD